MWSEQHFLRDYMVSLWTCLSLPYSVWGRGLERCSVIALGECTFLQSPGRPEKLPDVCYSWWVLASLKIIGRLHWINKVRRTRSFQKLSTACGGDCVPEPEDQQESSSLQPSFCRLNTFCAASNKSWAGPGNESNSTVGLVKYCV